MQIKTIFKPNLTLEKLYYGAESSYDQNEPEFITLSLSTNYNIPRYSVDYSQSLRPAPKYSYHVIPINFGIAKWGEISEKPNSIQTAIDNNYYYNNNNTSIDKITQSMVLLYTETKPSTVSDAANLKLYWNDQFVLTDKPQLITDAVKNNCYYLEDDGSYTAVTLLDTNYDSISEVYKKDLTVTYYELITENMSDALYSQITDLYKSTIYESLTISKIFKELPSYILIAKVENEYSDIETELLESEIYVYNVNDSKYYASHFDIESESEIILDYVIGDSLELSFDINDTTNKINWVLNEYRSEQYSWLLSNNGFIDISSAEAIYSILLSDSTKKELLFPQTYSSEVLFKEPKVIDKLSAVCWNQEEFNNATKSAVNSYFALNIENYGSNYGLVQKTEEGKENTSSGYGVSFGRYNKGSDGYYGILSGFNNIGIGQGANAIGGENIVGGQYQANNGPQTVGIRTFNPTFVIDNITYGIDFNLGSAAPNGGLYNIDTGGLWVKAIDNPKYFTLIKNGEKKYYYLIKNNQNALNNEYISGICYTTDNDNESNIWSLSTGEGNVVASRDALAIGYKNIVTNRASAAIGNRLLIPSDNDDIGKLVIGFNNNPKTDTLFEIGNGSNSDVRSNAFEISRLGVARAFGTPVGNNDLTPKSYVDSIKGLNGSFTVQTSDWNNDVANITISALGDYDALFLIPASLNDKTNIETANIFASTSGTTLTLTAQTMPSSNIVFNYFISKGAA